MSGTSATDDVDVSKFILGALSLTAALAWNEAASSGIKSLVPAGKSTFSGQLIYAIIVTLVVILIAYIVHRVTRHLDGLKLEPFTKCKPKLKGF